MSQVPDEPFEQSGVTLFKHFKNSSILFSGLCEFVFVHVCVESFNKNEDRKVFVFRNILTLSTIYKSNI